MPSEGIVSSAWCSYVVTALLEKNIRVTTTYTARRQYLRQAQSSRSTVSDCAAEFGPVRAPYQTNNVACHSDSRGIAIHAPWGSAGQAWRGVATRIIL
jgi:hypothetical protein